MAGLKERALEITGRLLARAVDEGLSLPPGEMSQRVAIGTILMQHQTSGVFDEEAAYKAIQTKYPAKPKPKAAAAPSPAKAPIKVDEDGDGEEDEEEEEKPKPKKKASSAAPKEKKDKAPAAAKKKRAKKAAEDDEDEGDEEDEPKPKKKKPAAKKPKKEAKAADDEDEEDDEDKPKKKKKLELACEANHGICEALLELAGHYFKEGDQRRGASYQKARTAVMACEAPIRSGAQAKKLSGIGDSIGKKIQEFIDTGTIEALEEIRARENEVM